MIKPRKRLVDSTVAALHLKHTYNLTIAASTIRYWATRGHIHRYTHQPGNGPRYDLNEIDAYIRRRLERGDVAP